MTEHTHTFTDWPFEKDPTLAQVSDLPPGWSAYRSEIGAEWERWENPPEEEDTCEHDEEAANQKATTAVRVHFLGDEWKPLSKQVRS